MTPRKPEKPWPVDPEERERWRVTGERRMLLDGQWRRLLEDRLQRHVGSVRRTAWGEPDLSANPYRVICEQLSTLYLSPPEVRHDEGSADDLIGEQGLIAQAGLWAQMQRYQSWVIGCRSYMMRVDVTGGGDLTFRPVAPDWVHAWSLRARPHVPVRIWELVLRQHPNRDEMIWTYDVLDISNPDYPIYQVRARTEDGQPGIDLSEFYLEGDFSGENYPYRKADGTPILPYAVHHAEHMGDRLWDYMRGVEMFEGSLTLAVLLSFWLHVFKDASWPQRWGINVTPAGLTVTDSDGNSTTLEVVTDPATLLMLRAALAGEGEPRVGQFEPGGDPVAMLQCCEAYSARIAHEAGVDSSDIQAMSKDPRSGYAISLKNDGKRAAQRRFSGQFRPSDENMVAIAAVLLNRATGSSYPEDGYKVVYTQIPLSPEETKAREESVIRLRNPADRLLSRVDAYIKLNPGLTPELARQDLERIDAEEPGTPAAITVASGAAQPSPSPGTPAARKAAPVEDVAKTALNGAQVLAMSAVVKDVAIGQLPAASVKAILKFAYLMPDAAAAEIVDPAEGFEPRPVDEARPESSPPPATET